MRSFSLRVLLNWKRESAGPSSNLLTQAQNLRNRLAGSLGLEILELVSLLGQTSLDALADLDGLVNVSDNTLEVLLSETAGGHGGRTNTDTTGAESRFVTRHGVLVARNVDLFQDGFDAGTVNAVGAQVDEDHVAVGAVGDELVSVFLEGDLESLCVLDGLFLVLTEFGRGGLLERNGQSGDGVVVRTTLVTREDGEVDGTFEIVEDLLAGLGVGAAHTLAEEDHGTTGSAEGFVGGGGDDVGVLKGRRNDAGSNQTRNVSHVDNQVSANGVGNLAHASIVDQAAVGGGTSNEDLGAVQLGVGL